MDRNGPVWCRNNIDYLTERMSINAGGATTVEKIGMSLIIAAALRISEGRKPTWYQCVAVRIAKRRFAAKMRESFEYEQKPVSKSLSRMSANVLVFISQRGPVSATEVANHFDRIVVAPFLYRLELDRLIYSKSQEGNNTVNRLYEISPDGMQMISSRGPKEASPKG